MKIFEFAYFTDWQTSINFLAGFASTETWDFSDEPVKNNAILKNYIEHIYRKLEGEKKILYSNDNKYACFNTGLITNSMEDVIALFEKNRSGSSPFYFKAFVRRSDYQYLQIFADKVPDVADFFQNPSELIFNPKVQIVAQIDHIINENLSRFPSDMQHLPQNELVKRIEGAIKETTKLVQTNYQIAVPQFYNGKIQLLIPLYLTSGSPVPDLSLAITKIGTIYTARTCLTIKMSYNNARLIVKPQSAWLSL